MDLFALGLSWTPNQGIGTPGFVDPENKVDSAADIALEAARRNMPIALELREGELFDTVRLEDERRRDNPLTSPQDVQRSGYNAYDFLEYVKYRRPLPSVQLGRIALTDPSEIREVLWWTEENSLQCHNPFATAPGSNGSLPAPGNESVLFTNCVSVERPGQVGPAINLIKQTLRNLPYYTTRESSRNQFKYAVGMNVEFLTFPTEFNRRNVVGVRGLGNTSFRQSNGYDIGPDGNVILDGTVRLENLNHFPLIEDQYLASCMSISVDKILVVNFHILHMIRNIETAGQLQQLAAIFEQIIFDISIIKVWFNPQDDIIVLDATLDEIYRGTPRGKFNDDGQGTLPLTERPELFSPTWKLRLRNDTQRAVFSTPRPAQFNFGEDAIWGMTCPYGFHNGAVDNYGHPCPCRTNNLDLAAMVELIMRDVGLVPSDVNGTQFVIRAWTEIRERCNYSDFEQCLLHGDRSSRLLRMLKSSIPAQLALPAPRYRGEDCAEECLQSGAPGPACSRTCLNYQQWAEVSQETKARMLRTFTSPSFQADPILLGYVASHAVGISMILRFLMTTENPRLLLERLRLWSNKPLVGAYNVRFLREPGSPEIPQYIDCRWHATSRLIKSVRLYVDNPSFRRCDMVSWIDDQVLRNSVHRPPRKVEFMEPERMLYYLLEEFWRKHPKTFGEYLVSKIVATPFRRSQRPAEDGQDDGGGGGGGGDGGGGGGGGDGDGGGSGGGADGGGDGGGGGGDAGGDGGGTGGGDRGDGGGDGGGGDGGGAGGGGGGGGGGQAEEEAAEPDRWRAEIENGYVQSQRQFTLDEILRFFDSPSWVTMSSDILQMVVGYFELKLMHEYQNDIRRVQAMRGQLDASLLGLAGLTPADLAIVAAARDALISTVVPAGPNWFTITRDLLTDTAQDHAVTAGGLFLKPAEESGYRDSWANRPAEIKALLQSLASLQALNASRELNFVQRLHPMEAQDSRDTLVTATLLGVEPFTMPALHTLLSRNTRATASSELATTDPIILYWALLVLRYARPHTRDRSRTFAERFFDLTYSPTNFYMPLLRRVVKRATPITRYERSQPGHHFLDLGTQPQQAQRGAATMHGARVPQATRARQEERDWGLDALDGDSGNDNDGDGCGGGADDWCNGTGVEPNWTGTGDAPVWEGDADELEEVPEPEDPADGPAGDAAEGPRGNWNPDLPPLAVTVSSLFFEINNEVTQPARQAESSSGSGSDPDPEPESVSEFDNGLMEMSVEKAQFLRMLQVTLDAWCN